MSSRTVAVIGAGPYGLGAAAHPRAAGGGTHGLGGSMDFWSGRMPAGMFLRSSWDACTISDPDGRGTLDAYEAATGPVGRPVPLDRFIEYGRWFAREAVGDIDERRVFAVRRARDGFELDLEDGDVLRASRVVLATGIDGFAYRPPGLAGLPPELVRHSVDVRDPGELAGRDVLIVGGGQSAIELAALLHEAGAVPEVVMRAPRLHWLGRRGWLPRPDPPPPLLYPPADGRPPPLNP